MPVAIIGAIGAAAASAGAAIGTIFTLEGVEALFGRPVRLKFTPLPVSA